MAPFRSLQALLKTIEINSGGYCSPAVTLLLATNTLIFLLNLFTGSPGQPSPIAAALWASDDIWRGQVWRPITAAFNHELVMHWFWNMVGLFFFGNHLERHFGAKGLWLLVLTVAVISNLFHVAVMGTTVLGFSGVVYAIIVGFAAIAPRARVLMLVIPMPAWVLAALFVGLDTLSFIQYGSSARTAYDVHLMGALCGLLAVRGGGLLGPLRSRWAARRQQRAAELAVHEQAELDRLLAKVSAQGLPSLSERERTFLTRFSQKSQQR